MKKLFAVLAVGFLILSLTACKKKEEVKVEVEALGGWTQKDEAVTGEALEALNKALEGMTGANYEPVKLLGTQVVAGINYKYLCNVKAVVPNATAVQKIVIVYKALDGTCSITSVEDYK